jgi:hypothetical protein
MAERVDADELVNISQAIGPRRHDVSMFHGGCG